MKYVTLSALMPSEFPRMVFAGNRVSEKGLFSAFVYNRVAYSLIFPVLSVLLAVLALWLPLRLPWLDPRLPWLALPLPWLALRLPWPVALCSSLQMARL